MNELYEFGSLEKRSTKRELPSEAIVFNGVSLDEELPIYRTLNVDGRENFSRSINSVSTSADGELFVSSKLDTNTITVKYAIESNGDLDLFNETFDKLKMLLQGDEKTFYFADEPLWERTGTVTSLENPDNGRTNIVGTFEIKMSNPYKRSRVKNVNGTSGLTIHDNNLPYPVQPETITIVFSEDVADFTLTADNKVLALHGGYKSGNSMVVDFKNKTIVSNNMSVLPQMLIPESNIFELKISNGTKFVANKVSSISVSYKGAMI